MDTDSGDSDPDPTPLQHIASLGVGPVGVLVVASFVGLSIAAVVVWSALLPGRGLHDRIAGTWLVPR
jgi:hypothetical protein